jgi:hypothetical protein
MRKWRKIKKTRKGTEKYMEIMERKYERNK